MAWAQTEGLERGRKERLRRWIQVGLRGRERLRDRGRVRRDNRMDRRMVQPAREGLV